MHCSPAWSFRESFARVESTPAELENVISSHFTGIFLFIKVCCGMPADDDLLPGYSYRNLSYHAIDDCCYLILYFTRKDATTSQLPVYLTTSI